MAHATQKSTTEGKRQTLERRTTRALKAGHTYKPTARLRIA